MHRYTLGAIALTSLIFTSGCAYYVPVQQASIARLSPEQVAAINSNDRLSPDQKQRLTDQNQQVLNEQDAARQAQTVIVGPGYPAYSYPGNYYPYSYPAYSPFYSGFYPGFYPGLSLSLGYVWGRSVGPRYGGGGWRGHR